MKDRAANKPLERTGYGDTVWSLLPFIASRFQARARFQPVAQLFRWAAGLMALNRYHCDLNPQL